VPMSPRVKPVANVGCYLRAFQNACVCRIVQIKARGLSADQTDSNTRATATSIDKLASKELTSVHILTTTLAMRILSKNSNMNWKSHWKLSIGKRFWDTVHIKVPSRQTSMPTDLELNQFHKTMIFILKMN